MGKWGGNELIMLIYGDVLKSRLQNNDNLNDSTIILGKFILQKSWL